MGSTIRSEGRCRSGAMIDAVDLGDSFSWEDWEAVGQGLSGLLAAAAFIAAGWWALFRFRLFRHRHPVLNIDIDARFVETRRFDHASGQSRLLHVKVRLSNDGRTLFELGESPMRKSYVFAQVPEDPPTVATDHRDFRWQQDPSWIAELYEAARPVEPGQSQLYVKLFPLPAGTELARVGVGVFSAENEWFTDVVAYDELRTDVPEETMAFPRPPGSPLPPGYPPPPAPHHPDDGPDADD